MADEYSYWSVKYAEACSDCDAAEVRYVMAFKPKITKDGDMWCALVGENLQEGEAGFGKSIGAAVRDLHVKLSRAST